MANLQGKLIQQGQALVYAEANYNFANLAAALQKDKAIAITIEESYLSKYDVADNLRKLVKDKVDKPPADIKPLLDPNKTIIDIANNVESYNSLIAYLTETLTPADFEPPLRPDFTSTSGQLTKPFPNVVAQDPRRTGRLIKPGPPDILKSTEVQKWLINNSMLYGFVLYDDNGLYYVGYEAIKAKLKSSSNAQVELKNIVGGYIKSPSSLALLTTTAKKVIDTAPPGTAPGDLEIVIAHTGEDNNHKIPELVVINNIPVRKDVGIAYIPMQLAAAAVGINLTISSGFRPGFGPNQKATTSKGRQVSMTTQESIRKDDDYWIPSAKAKYANPDDYFFKAPSGEFKPAVAKPGTSEHGSGRAIDLNTGGRTDFLPLKTENYKWLIKNSYKFGFIRTVSSEEWHFEYLPNLAKQGPYAKIAGTDANKFYTDLGLTAGQFTI